MAAWVNTRCRRLLDGIVTAPRKTVAATRTQRAQRDPPNSHWGAWTPDCRGTAVMSILIIFHIHLLLSEMFTSLQVLIDTWLTVLLSSSLLFMENKNLNKWNKICECWLQQTKDKHWGFRIISAESKTDSTLATFYISLWFYDSDCLIVALPISHSVSWTPQWHLSGPTGCEQTVLDPPSSPRRRPAQMLNDVISIHLKSCWCWTQIPPEASAWFKIIKKINKSKQWAETCFRFFIDPLRGRRCSPHRNRTKSMQSSSSSSPL